MAEALPKLIAPVCLAQVDYGLLGPIPSLEEVVIPPVVSAVGKRVVQGMKRRPGWDFPSR